MSSFPSSSNSAKLKEISVVVVGVSGSETVKGPTGVGKSLLCNRFVRPAADEFRKEHSSVLSQIDFCGSPVINKDHWLYWGSRVLSSSECASATVSFQVVEQTEFLDDETFEAIAGFSKSENYSQRCSRTCLQSRDKLMYIEKEQLGSESDYHQQLLPDGKLNVDGFILACDVSIEPSPAHSTQVINIAKSVAKTKKPIVIAFTKCDEVSEECKKYYLNLLHSTKELKHVLNQVPPVETSSVKNVNVEYVFVTLANLSMRSQKLIRKPFGYNKASLFVEQRNLHIKCCFSTLLSQAVPLCSFSKKDLSWNQVLADIDRHPDLVNFVTVFGSRVAFEMYERYVSEAKELWAMNRLRSLVPRLFEVFQAFLKVVDIAEMDWNMARDYMRCHALFNVLFEPSDCDLEIWSSNAFDVDEKSRLPAEVLLLPEAGNVFEQFRLSTHNLRLKQQLGQEFEYLLNEFPQIQPGFSLDSAFPIFQNFGIIKKLSPDIVANVYDRFQQKLMDSARKDFEECLLEMSSTIQNTWKRSESLSFSFKQLDSVRGYLEGDQRYEWMKWMAGEREQMILSYLSFLFDPSPLNCPSADLCIDIVGVSILNDYSEENSTFGRSSGFSECFEATKRSSGKKMPRVQISAMCGDRPSTDLLAAALFHNDEIRLCNSPLSNDGVIFAEILDDSSQNWTALEISMSSFHSWFHRNDDSNPSQSIDFTDGYIFVYNSQRASSFNYARCAIEQLSETNLLNFDCILLLAVADNGVSESMKLDSEYLTEGAELCKSIGAKFSVIDSRYRKTKANTLNIRLMEFLHDVCDGQVQAINSTSNSEISILEHERPTLLAPSFSSSGIQLLTKQEPTLRSRRQKPVSSNLRNRVTRTDPFIMSHFYSPPVEIQPAPLATPEAIDFSPAYSMVNDAAQAIIKVTGTTPVINKYEASPGRRSTTSTLSGSSSSPRAVSADVTKRSRTSNVSLSTDSINRLHRTSNLFQLHTGTVIADQKQKCLSIESLTKEPDKEKQGNRFVRKVASSFKLKKSLLHISNGDGELEKKENKTKTSATASPEQISLFRDKMASRSLPQSPRTDRKAKLYSSLNSTTEKVSNVLSWLPSKSSKRMMKNKSATHDLSTSLISYTAASTSTQGVIAANENLETLCASSTSGVPVYLEKCIRFIEKNGGFELEGLYRVPGNQTHLAELEKRFLKKGEFDVSSFDTPVHVAATALKSFFSCLPDSLIPTVYHTRWKLAMMNSEDEQKIAGIREAITQLPPANQKVLEYLVTHLTKVSCSPKTVMNSNNLSKVWTPTLFRPVFTSYEELSSGIIAFQLALELLIINSHSLFKSHF